MSLETTLCYVEREDEYLMLHRTSKADDANQGKWIGVGGKFEEGESPEECMMREVREETGLTVTQWSYRGIVTFVSPHSATEYMHLFTIQGWTGDMRECDEGELAWVPRERLFDLPHWEGDEIFLSLIRDQDVPFFSLKLVYDAADTLVDARLNGERVDIQAGGR